MTANSSFKKTVFPPFSPPQAHQLTLQSNDALLKAALAESWSLGHADMLELLDGAGIAALFMDPQMRVLGFSHHVSQITELFLSDVGRPLGNLFANLIGSDRLINGVRGMIETQMPADVQVQTASGLWFESRVRPYRMLDKIMAGAVITFVDITHLKKMESALLAGEARYRALVDWSPEAINVLRDGKFVYLNPAAIKLYGATSNQELLGHASRDRVHPDDLAMAQVRMSMLSVEHVNAPLIEMRFLKLDGTVMEVQAQAQEIEHEGAPAIHVAWRDITALKRSEMTVREGAQRLQIADEVLHLAYSDTLTNLPNRRFLNDRVNLTRITSKRTACYGALMFIDLDNFKLLNDTHGHEAGDLLLMEVGIRLKNCVREVDTVARFGGDEFVVLLSQLNVGKAESALQAASVAENISMAIALPYRLTFKRGEHAGTAVQHRCTASIGVALFISDESSHEDILKWADTAMYQAKKAGQNLIRFHDLGA